MLAFALLCLAAFAAMEGIAYLMHKYLMHGALWVLHESHHRPRRGVFEGNDLFGVFFALPSIVLIYLGTHGQPLLLAVGCGMTLYGAAYFGFHDVIVHRRVRTSFVPQGTYFRRIIRAHLIHHRTLTREGAVSFGFLYAPDYGPGGTPARARVIRKLAMVVLGLGGLWFLACGYFSLADGRERFSAEDLARPLPAWPAGFLRGTATAAHQIEGGNRNDWSRFEDQAGRIAHGDKSGVAVDHWNRMGEDVALMKDLKANAYRFSIEWSRVEPVEGQWNDAAFARYGELLGLLREAHITPMATLLHFSLPQWLADRGGVRAPDFPLRFAHFAGEAARRLGPQVDLWCVINEPNVHMYLGYVEGIWPPGHKSPPEAVEAFAGLLRGYALAAQALKRNDPGAQVGVAQNLILEPASRLFLPDWIAARGASEAFDWAFYDSIQARRIKLSAPGFPALDEPLPELEGSTDYFGANYYRRDLIRFAPRAPGVVQILAGPGPRNDLGWELYPEGLLRLLRQAFARYHLPIYVTENGIADARGDARPAYLRSHAYAMSRALAEGIPVKGYFHWTLMDNFEWAEGYGPRFGLYRVEANTRNRIPTPGAGAFAQLAPAAQP